MIIKRRNENGDKVREKGLIPGILYGGDFESTPIEATYEEFRKEFQTNGYTKTFEVKLDGKTHIVYIKDTQDELLNFHKKIHFDLLKVSSDDTMTAKVYVKYLNKDEVKKRGFVIQSILDEVEIEFPVGLGISNIELDVTGLSDKDTVKAGELTLPEGLKLLTDPESVVLSVSERREYVPEEPTEDEPVIKEVEAIKQSND